MAPSDAVPDADLATRIGSDATGRRAIGATRFTTGAAHYVFEVTFAAQPPVVVRLNTDAGRSAMAGASRLSARLRPLGVPLPAILAEDLTGPFPYLVLERLPGTDLGHVIDRLADAQLEAIGARVAAAQAIVAALPSAGRYGYAVNPAEAPHGAWSGVVEAHLERSRARIVGAGLFSPDLIDIAADLVANFRPRLDEQPATPFLHDTTTKNVIIAPDGSLSGIVDVDDLCFGDPRYVVALTLTALLSAGRATTYADAWMARAGFADDALFRLYVLLFVADFMSEHGQAFNGNPAPSSPAARQTLLRLFGDTLARIG